jgi:hypothetical protein
LFVSGALLWQIGDILSRPSWTSKDFRFQNFIELFEKHPQKVNNRKLRFYGIFSVSLRMNILIYLSMLYQD